VGEFAGAVEVQPVVIAKAATELADGFDNLGVVIVG
jgi:hypothetical protein